MLKSLKTNDFANFCCRNVFWNETGNLVCLATDDCYFILQVDTGAITAAIEAKQGLGEDGLEEAFDVGFFTFLFSFLKAKKRIFPITIIMKKQIRISIGSRRDTRTSENWFVGWRLLHLHKFSEPNQLLCRR